jgi:hypothetical protein
MELTTAAVTIASITEARKLLEPFFSKLVGAVGDGFADQIHDYFGGRRAVNLAAVVKRAEERASENGLDPSTIPLKVIHPLLEAASLEENADLQSRWAALLANAADPERKRMVPTAFVTILKELTPGAVKFLDCLYPSTPSGAWRRKVGPLALGETFVRSAFAEAGLQRVEGLPPNEIDKQMKKDLERDAEDLAYLLALLKRNGVIEESLEQIDLGGLITINGMPPPKANADDSPRYALTQLGINFIDACRAPKGD